MAFKEERSKKKIEEQERLLEHLSDLSRKMDDISLERKWNGVYQVPLNADEFGLVCEAVKNQLLSTARELQTLQSHERNDTDGKRQDATLTADDFTDLKEIYRDYYGATYGTTRTTTYIFTCNVQGEPDILTFELSLHDEYLESFALHTEKNDIWDNWDVRMGWNELQKLENKAKSAAAFCWYEREIRQAASADEVTSVEYSLWDDDDPNLSVEQRVKIEQMIDQKREGFQKTDFPLSSEDWVFDLEDPTERYAIYELSDEINDPKPPYEDPKAYYIRMHGLKVKVNDYYLAYGGALEPGETLKSINDKYVPRSGSATGNVSSPVGDVLVLTRHGKSEAYYVDETSLEELPYFVYARQQIITERRNAAEVSKPGDTSDAPEENNLRSIRMKR